VNTQIESVQSPQENYLRSLSLDHIPSEGKQNNVAVLTLLENGMIVNCNKAGGELLGVQPSKLIWQPISRLLPQLGEMSLMLDEKVNPYLRFLSIAGHRFEVIGLNGTHFASELFFSLVEEFGKCCLQITLRPIRQGQATTLRHLRAY
jgi:PAS domain-containing protein